MECRLRSERPIAPSLSHFWPKLSIPIRGDWYPEFIDSHLAERIHQQLAEIRQRDVKFFSSETHQFKLNPPIRPEVLEAFEEKHQVRLPSEYREFLLSVGNGGAGPLNGLYSLEWADHQLSGNLRAPNPFLPLEDAQPGWFEALTDDLNYDRVYDGALPIVSWGGSAEVLLIVSGSFRGRIVYLDWELDDPPVFSPFPGFTSWYETWLRELIAGYRMAGFGFGLPLNREESLTLAIDVRESVLRRKAALSNLLRVSSIEPEQLSVLYQALLTEHAPELVADMFVCLAQNGGAVLEEVIWSVLKRCPSSEYLRLVKAVRSAGLGDWRRAAWWGIEQDMDEESVRDLLYDLRAHDALSRQDLEKLFSKRHGLLQALFFNAEQTDPLPVPVELFTHPSPAVRRYSAEYQASGELESRLPHLLELFFQENDADVRQGWVGALTRSYVPWIVDALLESLKGEQRHIVRAAIIVRLGALKVVHAVPALLDSALNDNWILAIEAVTSLRKMATPEARIALETVISTDPDVFRGTGEGMVKYPKKVIDTATEQLQALDAAVED